MSWRKYRLFFRGARSVREVVLQAIIAVPFVALMGYFLPGVRMGVFVVFLVTLMKGIALAINGKWDHDDRS